MNIGEEIAAAYLKIIKQCEFTQLNLQTKDVQGEIDVLGVNIAERTVYVCEVAVHLTCGLRYVKDRRPNTAAKLIEKFSRDIEYAQKYYPDFQRTYMLWSPVVKSAGDGAKENQILAIRQIQDAIKTRFGVGVEAVINEEFMYCLSELRQHARTTTEELKSPVMRYLQIEEWLQRHLDRRKKV